MTARKKAHTPRTATKQPIEPDEGFDGLSDLGSPDVDAPEGEIGVGGNSGDEPEKDEHWKRRG